MMKAKKLTEKELRDRIEALAESPDELVLTMLYMQFDLEATRRERDYWKEKYGGK